MEFGPVRFLRQVFENDFLGSSLSALFVTAFFSAAVGADEGLELFEKTIRPTLIEQCARCHGPEEQEGGLQLDQRVGWVVGGDSGPAIRAGDPDGSLLIRAIRYDDPNLEMPPDGRLPDQTIAAFEQWVELGAVDPRVASTGLAVKHDGVSVEEGKSFWSFQPIDRPAPPRVEQEHWPWTDIDRFILARLEAEQIQPVADSHGAALVRRLYFDLTGLPPTEARLQRFQEDPSLDAIATLVDELLESPQFGERWGRHWLDVVRFAESSGGGRTLLFPNAWRYRDYVIDAFNRDLPYDEFVVEQIAGDLLPSASISQRQRRLIATAFLLLGPTNFELQDKDILEMDIVDEQLDTIGKSMLGMTMGCARCHNHKFDPIPARDYYAMAGILKSTRFVIHDNVSAWNKVTLPIPPEEEARISASEQLVTQAKEKWDAAKKQLKQATEPLKASGAGNHAPSSRATGDTELSKDRVVDVKRLEAEVRKLEANLKRLQRKLPTRPVAMAVAEGEKPADIPIAIRGVVHNRGEIVARGVLEVASQHGFPEIDGSASGRLELAQWIADRNNPLTARVMVNRVWHWLMGQGIVGTVDNFGAMGARPTHPELLDYLAARFIEEGWSVKTLIREIVLSRVYRLSAETSADGVLRDPENRLMWRMNRRRLEAEEIRDALLKIAGQLDMAYGGPNMKPGTKKEYGYQFTSHRRSVYVPVFRNALPELFEVFDFADPNIQGGKRATSTIAPQALLLMNHPFVIERAKAAANRLISDRSITSTERLEHVYQSVLGRLPTQQERQASEQFLQQKGSQANHAERWALLYQALFQSLDFRYLN